MGIYGNFVYGSTTYGLSSLPVSDDWEVFDFCYPTDASMGLIFAFSEFEALRPFGPPYLWLSVDKRLWVFSDDEIPSGLRCSVPVGPQFSLQFAFVPKELPADFSNTAKEHFFVGVANRFAKMIGIGLSENGGIRLCTTPGGAGAAIAGSAELFAESPTDLYTVRLVADMATGRGHLYLTRSDLIPVLGLQLRYTFDLLDTPAGTLDEILFSVSGTAAASSEVGLYCLRFSNYLRLPDRRPVAVPGPDQTVTRGTYAGFDGRESYDPEGVSPLDFFWTVTEAPATSSLWIEGLGTTPSDPTGYTNEVQGSAGDFSTVLPGDLLYAGSAGGLVVYVGSDFVVVAEKVLPAGSSVTWSVLAQHGWGGARLDDERTLVQERRSSPPVAPELGDHYLVLGPASGDFSGHEDEVALWSGAWSFASPEVDELLFDIAGRTHYRYVGGAFPAGSWQIDQPLPWEVGHWSGRTNSIGSFLPDVTGGYSMELLVYDGAVFSLPGLVALSVQETAVIMGHTPDMGWIWNYLPDFWSLFSDKGKVTTVWNGFAQVAAGLLLEAWQHDYSKAVLDIQRIFQRRWLNYSPWLEAAAEETVTIRADLSLTGYSAAPGSSPQSYHTGTVLPVLADLQQYLLVLDGVAYRPIRQTSQAIVTQDELPTSSRPVAWGIFPVVEAETTNFEQAGVAFGDTIVFTVVSADGTSEDRESFVYGARRNRVAFDRSAITADLADSTKTVSFTRVERRSFLQIYEYLVGIPRLQELIDRSESPSSLLLHENKDYVVDSVAVEGTTINRLELWLSFFTAASERLTGSTTADPALFETPGGLTTLFGVGADLSSYVLVFERKWYRLKTVVSDTELELDQDALPPGLSGEYAIRRLDEVPHYLWAEVSYRDNRPTIEANFGRLVGLTAENVETNADGLDYLSAVQGLWYTYWFGPRPYNLRVGSQILLGLPFAEKAGTVLDIDLLFDETRSRVLVQDEANTSIARSYFFPQTVALETNPETGLPYAIGDRVEQFAPLSAGVEIKDWVSHPDWYYPFVRSGDFLEVWKYHTFGIVVDFRVFSLKTIEFVLDYVLRIKPTYTRAWFAVEASFLDEVDVYETYAFGPVTIMEDPHDLPSTWLTYPTPFSWADSPWETRVTRSLPPTFDPTVRWPTGRYTGPSRRFMDFGNLHFFDTPGRVPDGWTGDGQVPTRAQGAFMFDARDGSGRVIHRFDDLATSTTDPVDGDMELPGVADWPDIAGAGPATKQKVLTEAHGGLQSLELEDEQAGRGVGVSFAPLVDRGFSVAVRAWVKVSAGQAHFVLYDQDGSTVLAEQRRQVGPDWQEVTLHAWSVGDPTVPLSLEVKTGPAGGHFFLDDVGFYAKQMPWVYWSFDRLYGGRTGGMTDGGSPDDVLTLQLSWEMT